jgi:phosphoenolpyruvate carboxylase
VLPLDVAPLFESVASLENAGPIIERLLADPVYRAHLQTRGNRQIVMIGYSDSNKAVGIVASRWLLREAQAAMVEACEAAGVDLLVFHGRGGSVSVGGGRTEGLVRSAPPGAIGGRLRVTEQGESVNERYGLRPIAMRSFERSVNAVALAAAGQPALAVTDPRWHEALAVFAEASRRSYRALVYDEASFVDYFQSVTPVDVIERMQIGSRPVTRAADGGIEALRAIPWMFAWSQSRHMLPGWLGVGSGISAVIERFGSDLLGEMYARWSFLATLLDDVEVVLAKADMGIAEFYGQLVRPEHERLGAVIRREFDLAVEHVLAVKGCARLLDSEPTLQRSIRLRNPYVDPIHLMQVDLLRRWRESGREDREVFDALVASVNGIAQGLQGSG